MTYQSADLRSPTQLASSRSQHLHWSQLVKYLIGCLGTVMGCYMLIVCSLLLLRATDNLPPPIVTNSLCFDDKLQWISQNLPSSPPDLLVFGSSVAWRHFDGAQAIESGLAKNPYNLAFCGARISQTAFVVNYFLSKQRFGSPHRALITVAPADFEGCTLPEEQVFLPQDADRALISKWGRLSLYLRNFDFVPLVRNAMIVRAMRTGAIALDPLVFTKSGDGPLDTNESRDLTYGRITAFSRDCFSALRDISTQLAERKIQFALLLTPLNPRWISEYDPVHRTLRDLRARILEALKGTRAQIWDASESRLFSEPDFADAVHLRWSAARRLTAAMADFEHVFIDQHQVVHRHWPGWHQL
jgi:hypothetical protein